MDDALLTVDGRRANHDLIDEHLSAWCGQRSSDEIVDCLWGAGVPVGKVMQPHRQTEIPQLAFRGFFEEVGHPINKPAPHSTLPMRMSRGPTRFHTSPAPLLGEHNHELLTELGLTDNEIADLEADGVIGRAPGARGAKKALALTVRGVAFPRVGETRGGYERQRFWGCRGRQMGSRLHQTGQEHARPAHQALLPCRGPGDGEPSGRRWRAGGVATTPAECSPPTC